MIGWAEGIRLVLYIHVAHSFPMRCDGELDAMVSLELQGEEMGVEIV